ncbi:MAG: hypothetical protein WCE48_03900 [Steroidobacteraceae bacterium]
MPPQPPPPAPPAAHVTPYDRLNWSAETAERLLISGEQRRDLIAYFGAAEYGQLSRLARRLAGQQAPAANRVYILPGIMGSTLGLRRTAPLPADVIWVDPIDITLGRITALHLTPESKIVPLGVLLYNYMHLRLRMRAAGFDAIFHDYDWRLGVDVLGAQLAARVLRDPAPRIALVAHSMGGLVARAALVHRGMEKISRLVMLGTPNNGSFAPVQTLRGTYPVVRRIAMLDRRHSPEQLARRIFCGFTSLYHMLPAPDRTAGLDLFDLASWPARGPRPAAHGLAAARGVRAALAAPDERFRQIVGTGERTVTGVELGAHGFRYRMTTAGDGTVPLALALLNGVPARFTAVAHSDLPKHSAVIAAVCDLVATGATRRLDARPRVQRAATQTITDADLRRMLRTKIDWAGLTADERRRFLDRLNEIPVMSPRRTRRVRAAADRVARRTSRAGTKR